MYYFFIFDSLRKSTVSNLAPLTRDRIEYLLRTHGNKIGCNDNDVWKFWIDGELHAQEARNWRIAVVPETNKDRWLRFDSFRVVDANTAVELSEDAKVADAEIHRKQRHWRKVRARYHHETNGGLKRKAANYSDVVMAMEEYKSDVLKLKVSRQRAMVDDVACRFSKIKGISRSWKYQRKTSHQYRS